ncbi:MAG: BREX-2 system adenine-specific DNA-methyltransferase PglX, partial [Planctomycetales bacterium]|nr:BREX-2 system adenine-specific DNA-methyltransferase PglX [Planctomycetales bacterium]
AVHGGFTGQITANSFMKREFGKKLIESFVPTVDLTHVVDTSGAYIPGHGTPTVILFGRNRTSVTAKLRAAMGIRGEPSTPATPKSGLVWQSICNHLNEPGFQNSYVSILDSPRVFFYSHPWSIGGGGAAELKESLDSKSEKLSHFVGSVGVMAYSGDDDVFVGQILPNWKRRGIPSTELQRYVTGDHLRDWICTSDDYCLFLYDDQARALPSISQSTLQYLWPFRAVLSSGLFFGKTKAQREMLWYEYSIVMKERAMRTPIFHFSAVSTHNNFVVTHEKVVCNRHSPVIEFRPDDAPDQCLGITGVLNSSVICFWLKQVAHNKGDSTDQHGARTTGDPAFNTFEYSGTMVENIPLSKKLATTRSRKLQELALNFQENSVGKSLNRATANLKDLLLSCQRSVASVVANMIAIQEELDWENYLNFELIVDGAKLLSENPPPLAVGERAFEIVLARQIVAGESQSTWFDRHGATPITKLPDSWPGEYKKIVERRIELIENDSSIRLIEQPEYKRRWNTEPWESQLERALREWLLLRLETYFDFDGRMTDQAEVGKRPVPLAEVAMYSIAQLADAARRDPQFMEVGELYRNDPAFDVQALVEELVLAESVPHLPILRYKDSGLRKRAEWEKTWELQRREDAGESVGTIPVPPKYTSADFISTGGARYWSLRGKLDVPKERWISFPHCEGPDGTLVICWAGYDHLQQAQAISAYYVRVQTEFGGSDDPRLIPLLASLIELLPWLKQWHNEPNASFDGLRMGDYFEGFVNEEARNLGKTLAEIKAWVPPKKVAKTRTKKTTRKSKKAGAEE